MQKPNNISANCKLFLIVMLLLARDLSKKNGSFVSAAFIVADDIEIL